MCAIAACNIWLFRTVNFVNPLPGNKILLANFYFQETRREEVAMFSFKSNQQQYPADQSKNHENDDEIRTAEAIQGDSALILKVIELNDLREFAKQQTPDS